MADSTVFAIILRQHAMQRYQNYISAHEAAAQHSTAQQQGKGFPYSHSFQAIHSREHQGDQGQFFLQALTTCPSQWSLSGCRSIKIS